MGFNSGSERMVTAEALNIASAINETLPNDVGPDGRTSVIRLDVENRLRAQGQIRDSITGLPIESIFRTENLNHRDESLTNLKMLYDLNANPAGTVALWLSPPRPESGLPLGKILVATKHESDRRRQIIEYDVTGQEFSRKQFSEFNLLLAEFFKNGYFMIPHDQDPWTLLRLAIPMDKAWEQMLNGEAEEKFLTLVEEMRSLVREKQGPELVNAVFLKTRADITLACPIIETSYTKREISANGNFVEHCGKCGISIHKYIASGYICSGCGGEYKGC